MQFLSRCTVTAFVFTDITCAPPPPSSDCDCVVMIYGSLRQLLQQENCVETSWNVTFTLQDGTVIEGSIVATDQDVLNDHQVGTASDCWYEINDPTTVSWTNSKLIDFNVMISGIVMLVFTIICSVLLGVHCAYGNLNCNQKMPASDVSMNEEIEVKTVEERKSEELKVKTVEIHNTPNEGYADDAEPIQYNQFQRIICNVNIYKYFTLYNIL